MQRCSEVNVGILQRVCERSLRFTVVVVHYLLHLVHKLKLEQVCKWCLRFMVCATGQTYLCSTYCISTSSYKWHGNIRAMQCHECDFWPPHCHVITMCVTCYAQTRAPAPYTMVWYWTDAWKITIDLFRIGHTCIADSVIEPPTDSRTEMSTSLFCVRNK